MTHHDPVEQFTSKSFIYKCQNQLFVSVDAQTFYIKYWNKKINQININ